MERCRTDDMMPNVPIFCLPPSRVDPKVQGLKIVMDIDIRARQILLIVYNVNFLQFTVAKFVSVLRLCLAQATLAPDRLVKKSYVDYYNYHQE